MSTTIPQPPPSAPISEAPISLEVALISHSLRDVLRLATALETLQGRGTDQSPQTRLTDGHAETIIAPHPELHTKETVPCL